MNKLIPVLGLIMMLSTGREHRKLMVESFSLKASVPPDGIHYGVNVPVQLELAYSGLQPVKLCVGPTWNSWFKGKDGTVLAIKSTREARESFTMHPGERRSWT